MKEGVNHFRIVSRHCASYNQDSVDLHLTCMTIDSCDFSIYMRLYFDLGLYF